MVHIIRFSPAQVTPFPREVITVINVEERAHQLTVEYLRILIDTGMLKPPFTPSGFVEHYKRNYDLILSELRKHF